MDRVGRYEDVQGHGTHPLWQSVLSAENHDSYLKTRNVRILLKANLRMGWIPHHVGVHRKNSGQEGWAKPKQLWHDLLTEFTDEFNGAPFFGGEKPDLVDFAAFGYMRSVSPFPQFSQLEDHENGMDWYRRIESTLGP